MNDISLPQYYRESFFANDTLLHPELPGGRPGVAGVSVPYTMRNDDVVTVMLLLCFVLAIAAFAHSRQTVVQQVKDFFLNTLYIPRADKASSGEAGKKSFFQIFLCLQTSLLLAITYFLYITRDGGETFVLDSPCEMIGIFSGVFLAYFLVKLLAYKFVNLVFFGSKKSKHWTWVLTFIIALEGVALFPSVILQVYFSLTVQIVVNYFFLILLLAKLLTIFKCWAIFFRQIGVFLQIILYLCALEIVPLLSLGGILVLITDNLKVNF